MKRKRSFALACVFMLLAGLLAGCGGSNGAAYDSAKMEAASPAYAPVAADAPAEAYSYAMDNYEMADGIQYSMTAESEEEYAGGTAGSEAVPANPNVKLIYTIDLRVETLDYDKSLETVESLITQYGGYVEYAEAENNRINTTYLRSAYYTLRVPADRLDAFLESCGTVGNICSSTRSTENRTAEYADLSARLNTLRIEEKSLQELLEKAEDLDTIVALHSYLSDVRYNIERVETSMRGIDGLVSYSTVHLSLSEVKFASETVTPVSTFGERLKARSAQAWRNFGESMESFSVFVLGELPTILLTLILYLIPVAIVVFVIVLLVRRGRKKRRARKQQLEQQQYAQPYVQPQYVQPQEPTETPKE